MTENELKGRKTPTQQQNTDAVMLLVSCRCLQKAYNMSCSITKPTKWPQHPAKTQINLGICPVWSVFAVRFMDS